MIPRLGDSLDFQSQALMLRSERQRLLASNIANADTPNYKAVDFDFAKAMKSALAGDSRSSLALSQTDNRHLAGKQTQQGTDGVEVEYRQAVQPSIDGNTVDMDVERSAFMDNSLRYQSTLTFLNRRISGLSDAIKGQYPCHSTVSSTLPAAP